MHSFREDVNGSQEAPDSFTPAHRVDLGQKSRTQEVSARLGYPPNCEQNENFIGSPPPHTPSQNLNSLPVFMNKPCYSMIILTWNKNTNS